MASLPADAELVAALRAGDEAVFAALVDAWSRNLLWLARSFVSTDASAQEVLQDTWVGVLSGLDRFQGRSSLKTWVYQILINTAKRRGLRESRTLPWSGIADEVGPSIEPGRFRLGHWREPPVAWPSAEGEALAREASEQLSDALAKLPPRQRAVIILRDAEGYAAQEVCDLLAITAVNQRVLLHRARASLRNRVERYFQSMAGRI